MARFDEIEIFATVVEAGAITGAAGRLGLSKSRVSEAVMALEERLGARLLDRTTRRVSPTEAGTIFYERCRRALDEAQAGVAEVMARQETPVGHLRIGAPEGFGDRYVDSGARRISRGEPADHGGGDRGRPDDRPCREPPRRVDPRGARAGRRDDRAAARRLARDRLRVPPFRRTPRPARLRRGAGALPGHRLCAPLLVARVALPSRRGGALRSRLARISRSTARRRFVRRSLPTSG